MRDLNPKLWNGLSLKPEVRKALLKIALSFKRFMDAPGLKIDDVLIVGSSASRWWTKHSDIDIHLVVDFESSVCPKWADGFFSAQKSLWNQTNDVSIYGHEVEVYVEDLAKPANSAGAFSLMLDRWVREPGAGPMREDDPSVIAKADALESEINDLLAGDPSREAVEELLDRLKRLRRDGLAADGEKSTENWAYKVLRSRKALYKLWAARKKLADDELSLNERIAPRVGDLWIKENVGPIYAYHATLKEFLPSIARDGLKASFHDGLGESVIFVEPDFENAAVYLERGRGAMLRFPTNGIGDTPDGENVIYDTPVIAPATIEILVGSEWKKLLDVIR